MAGDEVCFLSVRELGQRYRRRELSPVEVVKACLDRIDRHEGRLNAWVTVLGERALDSARVAEEELGAGRDRGPLHGIPVAVKDNMDTAGVRTTCASRILRDHVPDRDAFVVTRLVEAGAVLVGKTNLLEFAYGIVHPDYGACNNPWNVERTSGGSSSGSTAAVAAGMATVSLGTDTGGSIRIPASYCGIVGMKPTYGRVSRRGVFPLSWTLDHVGPLARTVEEAAILLETISGHDPDDPTSALEPVPGVPGEDARSVAGLRVGVVREHLGDDLHPSVRAAFEAAIRAIADAGADVEEVGVPALAGADDALMPAIAPEAAVIHERWMRERPEDYADATRMQLELGAVLPALDYVRAHRYRARLMADFSAAFDRADVLVTPTVAWEAPDEDPVVAGQLGAIEARRTAPHNLAGLPAVSIPWGTGDSGLPTGFQVAGPWMEDELVLRAALGFEILSGWQVVCPPGVAD